jgi:DNA invertase Pin-like site-specific DNA recombinase
MSSHPKIYDHHRQRLAYIYIRQSTLRQVAENQESQDLQYQLANRAHALGWPAAQTVVIDEDLGKTAVSATARTGFQRLFTDIGTGKVGILLVTDVSRLARNCADWYRLLDLTVLNDVLVCDSGGIYNARAYDDRMLLGIKGAFSEAQWHIMRQQMQAARLNKAKRGELAMRLPIGYDRLPNGEVILTPDQQVQAAIRRVFSLFERHRSCRAVLRHLRRDGLRLPRRQRNAIGERVIVWTKPSYGQVYLILKLPAYAGAYAYGKRQRSHLPGQPGTVYGRRLPPDKWQVLLHDTFPAYIKWEVYMKNQDILAHNWQSSRFADDAQPNRGFHNAPFTNNAAPNHRGAVGKGRALLQGMVVCGRCGRPMRVRYRDKPAYVCEATKVQYDDARCQFFPYAHVDQAVVAAFLEAIRPAAIEAALAALSEMETAHDALKQQWQQQLARAQYAVDVAQARYEQVDPAMRLVAAELEQAWETALQQQQRLQQEWADVQAAQTPISLADTALVRQLANDLPTLWSAKTTTIPDRKRLLRTLIADVTLDSSREAGITHLTIRWQTGGMTQTTAKRPRPGHPSNPQLLQRVRQLAQTGQNDEQIATTLNTEGIVSSWHVKDDQTYVPGQPVTYWTRVRVRNLRNKHQIPTDPTAAGLVSAQAAAKKLGVSFSVLLDWFRRGLLPGRQRQRGAPVWIPLDEALLYRISGHAPRDLPQRPETQPEMVPLPQAAARFGLTAEQMRQELKNGRFLTWRLQYGRQYRWYVQEIVLDSAQPADPQPK